MQSSINGGLAFSYVNVTLEPGETITMEPDAMSSMDAKIELKANFNGGFIKGLLRKYLGGESLFISTFSNPTDQARSMTFVQGTPGEIKSVELKDSSIYLQPGAYLASTGSIKIALKWAGFTSFIAREGLFRLQAKGDGRLWYGAYGALLEKEIDGEYVVDTSHLLAYDEGISLKLQLAGGIFSSFFGGEGLVTRVKGKGRIVIQTRSLSGLSSWLNPKF